MEDYTQEDDFKYFLDNQEELIKKYPNKFLVIKNKSVIGAFDDQVTAYTETTKSHKPGSFIIQHASKNSTDTQVFHSRVISAV